MLVNDFQETIQNIEQLLQEVHQRLKKTKETPSFDWSSIDKEVKLLEAERKAMNASMQLAEHERLLQSYRAQIRAMERHYVCQNCGDTMHTNPNMFLCKAGHANCKSCLLRYYSYSYEKDRIRCFCSDCSDPLFRDDQEASICGSVLWGKVTAWRTERKFEKRITELEKKNEQLIDAKVQLSLMESGHKYIKLDTVIDALFVKTPCCGIKCQLFEDNNRLGDCGAKYNSAAFGLPQCTKSLDLPSTKNKMKRIYTSTL